MVVNDVAGFVDFLALEFRNIFGLSFRFWFWLFFLNSFGLAQCVTVLVEDIAICVDLWS